MSATGARISAETTRVRKALALAGGTVPAVAAVEKLGGRATREGGVVTGVDLNNCKATDADLKALVGLLAAACLGWAIGTVGWRLVHRTDTEPRPRAPRELLAVTLGTVALALAGLVIAFTDV